MISESIALVLPKQLSGYIVLRCSGEIRARAANGASLLSRIEQNGAKGYDYKQQETGK